MLLLKPSAFPVRISQVQVLAAATHRVLLNLTGAALKAEFTPVSAPEGDEGGDDPGNPLPIDDDPPVGDPGGLA